MLTQEQLSLIGTYRLSIIDVKTLKIFEEAPILGYQQRMNLSFNQDLTGYKVRFSGAQDATVIRKYGCAKWVDNKLVFYFPEEKNCQYSIKTLVCTITQAQESFRGFLMTFELEKVMYCIRCER